MNNIEELKESAQLFLNQMDAIRGNEHWRESDEKAYQRLKKALDAAEER